MSSLDTEERLDDSNWLMAPEVYPTSILIDDMNKFFEDYDNFWPQGIELN